MTETRPEYGGPREHYLRCDGCDHRIAFVTTNGDIVSILAADWKMIRGRAVIRCHRCGKWVHVGGG